LILRKGKINKKIDNEAIKDKAGHRIFLINHFI
jgi:hypothetical protein